MNDVLWNQFWHQLEVTLHIPLYLFEHRSPHVEFGVPKQRVEEQAKTFSHLGKTWKELRLRADSLADKASRLGKKYDERKGVGGLSDLNKATSLGNYKNNKDNASKEAFQQ